MFYWYNISMPVLAEWQKKGKLEKAADVLKWVSITALAVGAVYGVPLLVGAALLDLGISDPLTREMIEAWKNFTAKFKNALSSQNSRTPVPAN